MSKKTKSQTLQVYHENQDKFENMYTSLDQRKYEMIYHLRQIHRLLYIQTELLEEITKTKNKK